MKYLDATLKLASNGEFSAIASAPTVDRDGERIAAQAFSPLPAVLPVLVNHQRNEDPVGRAIPRYVGNELHVTGTFASTKRAQEVRDLVVEGALPFVSVGFMGAKYAPGVKPPTITSGDLFEISLVSVPSNREARVIHARSFAGDGASTAWARKVVTDVFLAMAQADIDEIRRDEVRAAKKMLTEVEFELLAARDPREFARRVLRDIGRI